MVKTRIADCSSVDRNRSSPNQNPENGGNELKLSAEEKEWEEAICPICMEHPHNAVLLICSSHQLGCRPYMCNTISLLSNCFKQFCLSYGHLPLVSSEIKNYTSINEWIDEASRGIDHLLPIDSRCPFCRGVLYGYLVIKSARQYMNSRRRNCPDEICDFTGSYAELRNHARSKHASNLEKRAFVKFILDWPILYSLIERTPGDQSQIFLQEEEQEYSLINLFDEP